MFHYAARAEALQQCKNMLAANEPLDIVEVLANTIGVFTHSGACVYKRISTNGYCFDCDEQVDEQDIDTHMVGHIRASETCSCDKPTLRSSNRDTIKIVQWRLKRSYVRRNRCQAKRDRAASIHADSHSARFDAWIKSLGEPHPARQVQIESTQEKICQLEAIGMDSNKMRLLASCARWIHSPVEQNDRFADPIKRERLRLDRQIANLTGQLRQLERERDIILARV